MKPKLTIEADASGQYRWQLKHGNNKVLDASSESFSSAANARRNLRRTRDALNQLDEADIAAAGKRF